MSSTSSDGDYDYDIFKSFVITSLGGHVNAADRNYPSESGHDRHHNKTKQ